MSRISSDWSAGLFVNKDILRWALVSCRLTQAAVDGRLVDRWSVNIPSDLQMITRSKVEHQLTPDHEKGDHLDVEDYSDGWKGSKNTLRECW